MQPSKKHIEFIRLVANGTNQSEAYRATVGNPKATNAQVKSKASNLARKYLQEITEAKQKAQKVVELANESKEAQIALKGILTQAQVDKKLCSIINGELQEVQVLVGTKVVKAMITPTITEMKQAADTYYKRFGSNAPTKTDIKLTDKHEFNIGFTKE